MHMHDAVRLLRAQHSGVLSTHSVAFGGSPFGSVTPFLMTETGDIVIYASDIAEHSKNISNNDQVSLCVYDIRQNDSQVRESLSVVGNVSPNEVDVQIQAQYISVFPQVKTNADALNFQFYLIKIHQVHYITGFGETYWFSEQEWSESMYSIAPYVEGAIKHMHSDHADALAKIITKNIKIAVKEGSVKMLSCFQHGFHYELTESAVNQNLDNAIGFMPFKQAINEQYDLRAAMLDLTKSALQDITN